VICSFAYSKWRLKENLKSAKDLVNEPSLKDELAIKGGIFTVVNQKKHYINNIHV
jgi:hypothetical protein